MLRVSATFDGQVCRSAHLLTQLELENGEVGNGTIVHEAMSAKDERMVVDRSDRCSARGTYVRHEHSCLCIGADRAEVQIVRRWLDALVHGRSQAFLLSAVAGLASIASLEVGIGRCVPDDTYAIDVVDHITGSDEMVLGDVTGIMRHQSWKKVLVNLICERMLGRDNHIFEETRLRRRYVCKPA